MPKRESEPLERVHLTLFSSDLAWLRTHYGENQLGISKAVRAMIRSTIKKMEEKLAAKRQPVHLEDSDFPELPEEEALDG